MTQSDMQNLRILLTGFGPFPGVEHNASADMVKYLTNQNRLPLYHTASLFSPPPGGEGLGVGGHIKFSGSPPPVLPHSPWRSPSFALAEPGQGGGTKTATPEFENITYSQPNQHTLIPHIFTCEWEHVETESIRLLTEIKPHIALQFGVSAQATGLQLETHAYNECCILPDAIGLTKSEQVLRPTSPKYLETDFPIAKLHQHLQAIGYLASLSQDPGRYLCNLLYYNSLLQKTISNQNPLSLFIHIPVFPKAHIFAGAAEILFFAIRAYHTYIRGQEIS